MAGIIGEFKDYNSLRDALRAIRETQNISFELLDELAGMSRGHSSKVLAPHGSRRITLQSLAWIFGGLGVNAVLVNDPDTLKMIQPRLKPRDNRLVRNGHRRHKARS
jgi:transcriptional regulator with XRE-family HTH domain